jgi:cytochrome c biogenesis protein CcmG/thiol:disulfide interchange protein DsbE
MRRLMYILPLLLFLGLGVAFLRGFDRDPREIPSALIDKPVPEFSLPPLPGHKQGVSSADLKGDVQLVNVFASWCIPCRAEHPIVSRLAEHDRVPVRAINYKDKPEDALGWLARNGDPYAAIGADRDGRASIDWGVYGVPETFLIDRQGRIRFKVPGPLSPAIVEEEILPLIAKLRSE